jgi:hypothetical protein
MAAPADAEWVSLETYPGPFCGRCDTTKIIVAYDGRAWIEQGHWAGNYRNWRVRRREVRIDQGALVQFRARLEAVRPAGALDLISDQQCETYASDSSGVIVVWNDQRGASRLHYDFGCDTAARRELRQAVTEAPGVLQIENLHMREWEAAPMSPSDQIELQMLSGPSD